MEAVRPLGDDDHPTLPRCRGKVARACGGARHLEGGVPGPSKSVVCGGARWGGRTDPAMQLELRKAGAAQSFLGPKSECLQRE